MTQASKTFRVFVSSTFSDLKAERNALQKDVFPRLRELCMRHGCRFQAIDLRWGVSEEAALDQQTMKICLKEIARCQEVTPRPNFIVLLGDRYGWRPLPAEIPADEFAAIKRQVTSDADLACEADLALLDRFYLLDENALYRRGPEDVPVGLHCLQRRKANDRVAATDQEREVTREAEAAEWRQVESHLRRILLGAVASLDLRDGELAKYHASATEQEIMRGAMNVADAEHHVSCFFRSLRSANERPLGEDLPRDDAIQDFIDLDDDGSLDNDAADQLRDLQARLREHLGKNVHEYDARWLGSGVDVSHSPITLDHIGTLPRDLDECLKLVEDEQAPALLCVDVWRRLARAILEEIAQIESVPAVQREKEEHQTFGAKRAKHFRGRARYLDAIQQYVNASGRHPFALWGESGSGKSALLARAAEQIRETNPNAELVVRFIGATPQSSDVRALFESLCHEISVLYGAEQETIPADYNGLVKEFPKRLALATAQKPLVIMLDALDQLSDAEHGRNLIWLPIRLPENVRVIVSTIPGECLETLQRKNLAAENILCLEAMPRSEGGEVLALWLQDADRTLQDDPQNDQRGEVLNRFAANGLPLYLKLAFEEARLWHSYDGVSPLAEDVPGIISDLFARLSDEANHGAVMVSRSLGYLAAARNGLTEDEILAVLSSDKELMSEFKRRSVKSPEVDALPVVVWSRLYFDLEPYLTERCADNTSLLSFYHRQLGEVTTQKYLVGEDKQRAHKHLADYFDSQDYWLESIEDWRGRANTLPHLPRLGNLRKADELAWQWLGAEQWDKLESLLTSLSFLEAKNQADMTFDLASDFTRTLKVLPSARPQRHTLRLIEEALRRDVHFIARHREDYPQALFQCLWNSCWWYDCPQAASHYGEKDGPWSKDGVKLYELLEEWRIQKQTDSPGFRWLRSLRPPLQHLGTAQIVILKGHGQAVQSVAISTDSRRIVFCGFRGDKAVRIWDTDTGKELRVLEGHEGWVNSVAISADSRWIISGSMDKTVRIWDIKTGEAIRVLKGHKDGISSVAISADGQRVVSGSGIAVDSGDCTVRVWDTETGAELSALRGHEGGVKGVAISSDSRRVVSCSDDHTVRVWDAETGAELMVMKGHKSYVVSVVISADDRWIVSGSGDRTVRVWDMETGAELKVLRGHKDSVACVAISADSQRIISGGAWHDKTVRIWDLQTGAELGVLRGHENSVWSVAVGADGRRIVSGSADETVRIWETNRGEELRVLKGHQNTIRCVAICADTGLIVSGGTWGDKTLRIWDMETGEELRVLKGHDGDGAYSVDISADGQRIVSGGSWDKTIRVWDVETGAELKALRGHGNTIWSVAISPDSKRIVSSSSDRTVRVWDMETGEELKVLKVETARVAISADSKRIVSDRSGSNPVRVWDMETGEEVLDDTARDVRALADKHRFPLKALRQISETVVEDENRNFLAFFPEALYYIQTYSDGKAWTGPVGRYLGIIRLEGCSELSS